MTTPVLETPASGAVLTNRQDGSPAGWSGVFAMALCAFALVASEFMPVSLLTPLASDLGVSEGMAGQGIAISGACAVITSLFISTLAGRMDRKVLLLWLTAAMCISGSIVASAHSYPVYMVGRAVIGVVVGGFWSMSAATAMRLVPAADIPRALAVLNGGNALATVIAAPLGSYLGAVVGWRGAFFFLVPVAAVAFIWQWVALPKMASPAGATAASNVLGLLRKRAVLLGMSAAGLFFMGQFMLYTYLRPFLETVAHLDASSLSLVLLVIGIAGFVGTSLIGAVLKRSFHGTLIVIPLIMAAIAVALIAFGHWLAPVVVLLGGWGLVATAAPVGWWSWVAQALPHDAEAGGGLLVAMVQLSIGLGSTVGGLLYDHSGFQAAFGTSAALLVLAAALAHATFRTRG